MDLNEEQLSCYLFDLLRAVGYSQTEVSIRHLKWFLLNITENALQKFHPDIAFKHYTGSASEGVTGGLYYNGEKSDHDMVQVLRKVRVIQDTVPGSVQWTDARDILVVLEADLTYPGYARLPLFAANKEYKDIFVYNGGVPYLQNWFIPMEMYILHRLNSQTLDIPLTTPTPHGPAMLLKSSCSDSVAREISKMIGSCPKVLQEQILYDIDYVDSVHTDSWPKQAKDWVLRQKKSGWLSESVVEEIVASGCLLVPVGHADSNERELLWRISFNRAEQIIVQNLNQVQLCCYSLLKIILKDFINSVEDDLLSSYLMKITVFWFSERTKTSEMVEANLIGCLKQCLVMIRNWLLENHMPNYFIKEQNMLNSKFTQNRVTNVVDAVNKLIADPVSVLNLKSFERALKTCDNDQRKFGALLIRSILNSWIELRLGLLENLHFAGKNDLLWKAYAGFNTNESIRRYRIILTELSKKGGYLSLVSGLIENSLGLLLYAKYNRDGGTLETLKKEAEAFLTKPKMVDAAHVPLRWATFLVMEKRFEEALCIADGVLQNKEIISNRGSYLERLYYYINEFIHWNININQPQQLTDHYDDVMSLSESNLQQCEMIYCRRYCEDRTYLINIPRVASKYLCFDVSFMIAEMDSLPRPIQLELLHTDIHTAPNLKIHPAVYGLFIRFHCYIHLNRHSDCCKCLQEFDTVVKEVNQKTGYNLLVYCYGQMQNLEDAARCALASLRIDPTINNVAFSYFNIVCDSLLDK